MYTNLVIDGVTISPRDSPLDRNLWIYSINRNLKNEECQATAILLPSSQLKVLIKILLFEAK